MAHDASATWSGFNYQGKVALFHTLYHINEKLSENPDFDFSGYNLTLEHHEDFEISNSDVLISCHQVKAHKDPAFSNYRNALLEMALELRNYSEVRGFFHTWQEITLPDGKGLEEAIREDIESIITEYNDSEVKTDTYIEKALSGTSNPPKRAAILRKAFSGNGDTAETIIHALRDICAQDTGSVGKIKQYKYPDGRFACELENVETFIKNELQSLYNKIGIIYSTEQQDRAYHFLLGELDRHIIERHHNISQNPPLKVSFENIISILRTDFENVSDQYLLFHFKDLFVKQFERFCAEPGLCPDDHHSNCNNGGCCNLRDITNILFKLPAESLWCYYQNFVPHKDLCKEKNILNALNFDIESVLNVLFSIFYELNSGRKIHRKSSNQINYNSILDDKNLYLPTAIGQGLPSTLAKDILNNPLMIEILFEVKTLIAGVGVRSIDNLKDALNQNRSVESLQVYCRDLDDVRQEKINDIVSDLRLIPLNQAKDEINVT